MRFLNLKFKNFAGFFMTPSKSTVVEIDFTNQRNNLILIFGDNGSGKTTLGNSCHIFPDNKDGRHRSSVRLGHDGEKSGEIVSKSGKNYRFRILYNATKTGHSSRCFLSEKVNGEYVELNDSGLVKTYLELVYSIFKINYDYLIISRVSQDVSNFVSYQPIKRKSMLAKMLPNITIWVNAEKNIKEHLKSRKTIKESIEYKLAAIPLDSDEQLEINENNLKTYKMKENELRKMLGVVQGAVSNSELSLNTLYLKLDEINVPHNGVKAELNNVVKSIEHYNTLYDKYRDRDINLPLVSNIIENEKEKLKGIYSELDTKRIDVVNLNSQLKEYRKSLVEFDTSDYESTKNILASYESKLAMLESIMEKEYKDRDLYAPIYNPDTFDKYKDLLIRLYTNVNSALLIDMDIVDKVLTLMKKGGSSAVENHIRVLNGELNSNNSSINVINDQIIRKQANIEKAEFIQATSHDSNGRCSSPTCPHEAIIGNIDQLRSDVKEMSVNLASLRKDSERYSSLIDGFKRIFQTVISIEKTVRDVTSIPHDMVANPKYISSTTAFITSVINNKFIPDNELDDVGSVVDNIRQRERLMELITNCRTKLSNIENTKTRLELINKSITDTQTLLDKVTREGKALKETKLKSEELVKNKEAEYIELTEASNAKENLDRLNDRKTLLESLYEDIKKADVEYRDNKSKFIDIENEIRDIEINHISKTSDKISRIKSDISKKEDYISELKTLNEDIERSTELKNACSITTGEPLKYTKQFLSTLISKVNDVLTVMYKNIRIGEYDFADDKFVIPVIKVDDNELIPDIFECSSGERSTLIMAFAYALLVIGISDIESDGVGDKYNIITLDEIDAALDVVSKSKFPQILKDIVNALGIEQCFIISHNPSMLEEMTDIINMSPNNEHKSLDMRGRAELKVELS